MLMVVLAAANGAESTDVEVLGFSGDGTYMAFHVVGRANESGPVPVRDEVFILDVRDNVFAAEESLVLTDSPDSLEEYGILPGNGGSLVYQYTGPARIPSESTEVEHIGFSIGTGDKAQSYTVILEPRELPRARGFGPSPPDIYDDPPGRRPGDSSAEGHSSL